MNEFVVALAIMIFFSAVFYFGHLLISSTPINIRRRNNGRVNVDTNRVGVLPESIRTQTPEERQAFVDFSIQRIIDRSDQNLRERFGTRPNPNAGINALITQISQELDKKEFEKPVNYKETEDSFIL